jgi:energy-coupling factor transport system permease protein
LLNIRYKDTNTPIHRLSPFCKMIWVIDILVLALVFQNPLYISLLFLSTLAMVAAAGIWKQWGNFMKLVLYLGIITIIINAIVINSGAHVLFELPFEIPALGTINITLEAIFFGLMMTLRLLAIVSAFTIINFTVNPDDIMMSLIKLKLPYKSVMVTSLSSRFVPAVIDDIERLTDVQRARGLEIDRGKFFQRLIKRASILIPLLSNSLDRTVQVAEAMESRAFGNGKNRTFFKQITFSGFDVVTIVFTCLPLAMGIAISIMGYGTYSYYPSLDPINISGLEIFLMILLFILLISPVPLALLKRRIDLD